MNQALLVARDSLILGVMATTGYFITATGYLWLVSLITPQLF